MCITSIVCRDVLRSCYEQTKSLTQKNILTTKGFNHEKLYSLDTTGELLEKNQNILIGLRFNSRNLLY